MSGHSKWHSIKHKKGAADAKRGKIFTRHAKLIAIAARRGSDSNMNAALRTAVINAKADNVPGSNIEKAIKKGSGEDKDAAVFEEITYEGYGPEGTALLIEVITDNKNRALTSVKTIMGKYGGRMVEAGSVSWMFDRKGLVIAKAEGMERDEAELAAIDAGSEDLSVETEAANATFEIVTDPARLMQVRDNLEKAGFVVEKAELSYLPKNTVLIDDQGKAQKVLTLLEALEDDEDVSDVYSNFDIPEEMIAA